MEAQENKLREELGQLHHLAAIKDEQLREYEEVAKSTKSTMDRIKELEKENSEIKASQLMSVFGQNNQK